MKTRILTIATLIFFVLSRHYALAQEPVKSKGHEIYVYGNLHDLVLTGLAFKSEIKEGLYFRTGASNLSFNGDLNKPGGTSSQKISSFSGEIQAGLEKRVNFTEKLSAFYGVDLITSGYYFKNKSGNPDNQIISKIRRFTPGFSFGSGFVLNIIKNFSVALEVNPSLLISFETSENIIGSQTVNKASATTYKVNFDSNDFKIAFIYHW